MYPACSTPRKLCQGKSRPSLALVSVAPAACLVTPHPCTVGVQYQLDNVAVIAATKGLISATRICAVPNRKTPERTGRCMHTPGCCHKRGAGRLPHSPQATCFSLAQLALPLTQTTSAHIEHLSNVLMSYSHSEQLKEIMSLYSSLVTPSVINTLLIGLAILLAVDFLRKAWRARRYMRVLQKQGLVSECAPTHIRRCD